MQEEVKPVINRILLSNGGVFETTMTKKEYVEMQNLESNDKVEIVGVFGENLVTRARNLTGFIDRKDLDIERAMESAKAQQEAMMQKRSPLVGGARY